MSEHDLVIRGGTVVDGTGEQRRTADVAVSGGCVTEVGRVDGRGRREVDADGLLVTPGWVDVHTHYDGQVTWDDELTPSSAQGVTTVVMGNCGVGFAPVRPGSEAFLIELMEAVEDIPGTALHEGIDWQWETFGEYLDAVARTPRALEVAAQVPHVALRAYVMGERAHEEPTAEEIGEIARVARESLVAGAVGISTSRTILHASRHGLIPGTTATPDEVVALAGAIGEAGHGVFQLVSDNTGREPDRSWMIDIARQNRCTVTYLLAQVPFDRDGWRAALDDSAQLLEEGIDIVPQVGSRPTGMLFGLQSTLHPFATHPTYGLIADLPLSERVVHLSDPQTRANLLAEEPGTDNPVARALMSRWDQMFPLGDPPDYEPPEESSVGAVAAAQGRRPEEVALDWLLERDGKALVFAPLAGYVDHNHDVIRRLLTHPRTMPGLSDGGAHCGLICDASMPTYLLTHWVRDRHRGERITIEEAVRLQANRTAEVYGMTDRGSIEPGKRADINLIDFDALALHAPEMVFDLPAGGRRLSQRVDGYRATFLGGEQTFADGEPTGARPGGLVRSR